MAGWARTPSTQSGGASPVTKRYEKYMALAAAALTMRLHPDRPPLAMPGTPPSPPEPPEETTAGHTSPRLSKAERLEQLCDPYLPDFALAEDTVASLQRYRGEMPTTFTTSWRCCQIRRRHPFRNPRVVAMIPIINLLLLAAFTVT